MIGLRSKLGYRGFWSDSILNMKKVLFTNCSFKDSDIEKLKFQKIEIRKEKGDLSENELIAALQDCQGYVIGGADKATRNVIEKTNLKIINFYGTGYENYVNVKVASEKDIVVANTPKANAYTVAEHSVALILDAVKGTTWLNNSTKKGGWNRRITWNLQGKTLGVIGMGTIGSHVATILHNGFGMNVIYTSRSQKNQVEKEMGAKKVSLEDLFSESDVITIHSAYNEKLVNKIGKEQFSVMKKHAVLVNAARAELVDPVSLKESLENNVFATAAFDAYYKEPAPELESDEWRLLSLPDRKFIITPHTAYGSKEAFENMNNMVIENLTNFFEGKDVPYKVN